MQRSAQRTKKKTRSFGGTLGLLLLMNIIPLIILAVVGVKYAQGEIEIQEDQIPEGMGQTFAWVGGVFVALLLVASVSLPAAHDGVKAVQGQLSRGRKVLRGEEEGSKVTVVLAWPFLVFLQGLGSIARFALIVLSFALIALLVLFVARLNWPELGQDQIDAVLKWGEGC
ncbi:MAG: hypothetical protein HRU14_02005 [Planctomycetes bacterium]|nr:hypothetical protein [Planctomycetota bacterium]